MKAIHSVMTLLAVFALAAPASAVFVQVDHVNADECDFLAVPKIVDELGIPGVFPDDEIIDAEATFTNEIACPDSYQDFGVPNSLVVITNLTPTTFDNLWYVADPQTRFSNVDGFVNGEEAFKIDTVGLNRPLVFESATADGLFEPGETWHFVVDNYSNTLSLPPSALLSPGRVGALSGGDDVSSASIIATRVPEPAAGVLLLFGLAAGFSRGRVGA